MSTGRPSGLLGAAMATGSVAVSDIHTDNAALSRDWVAMGVISFRASNWSDGSPQKMNSDSDETSPCYAVECNIESTASRPYSPSGTFKTKQKSIPNCVTAELALRTKWFFAQSGCNCVRVIV